MNVLTAIRIIMALCRVLGVSIVDLAGKYIDAAQCQADFDELVAIINAEKLH